jgi:hypothetical protein
MGVTFVMWALSRSIALGDGVVIYIILSIFPGGGVCGGMIVVIDG